MTIHDIIDMLKTDPKGISIKFGIPLRTIYGWCNGQRVPADYIITMMLNIILLERRLNDGENTKGLRGGMETDPGGIKETGKES